MSAFHGESSSGHTSPTTARSDLEVERVMLLREFRSTYRSGRSLSEPKPVPVTVPPRSESSNKLPRYGSRKSAFSPYKPTTVLTNLQRGNVETHSPCCIPDPSIHQLAAQGELVLDGSKSDKSLNEFDKNGFTPLMWAAFYGQVPTVNMLLERRVSVDVENQKGENALLLASCNGHSDVVKLLLDRKMDVDHADELGNTALMYAAFGNHAHCAQELLQHNADITKENRSGDTAYSLAINRQSRQVQIILEKFLVHLLENIQSFKPHNQVSADKC